VPELPEVEIAARNLRAWAEGKAVRAVIVHDPRVVEAPAAEAFVRALKGRRIEAIDRRGKWLRLRLDDGSRVFSHLGMTGKWVRRAPEAEPEPFERARVDLRDPDGDERGAVSLRYRDPRLFGRLHHARDDLAAFTALGPDPLVDGIDVARLHDRLARTRRAIKDALLDQAILAGVGNIQATEALWLARVDPRRPADQLARAEVRAIARGLERSIEQTLAHESGPEITYVEEAGAPNPFTIYGHGGDPCPRCRAPLDRYVLGGRGTVSCPRCQPTAGRPGRERREKGSSRTQRRP
jgi:formamidopyrimidine-DNA glycosylase